MNKKMREVDAAAGRALLEDAPPGHPASTSAARPPPPERSVITDEQARIIGESAGHALAGALIGAGLIQAVKGVLPAETLIGAARVAGKAVALFLRDDQERERFARQIGGGGYGV